MARAGTPAGSRGTERRGPPRIIDAGVSEATNLPDADEQPEAEGGKGGAAHAERRQG
jgi:hypothetical protein